MKIYAAWTSLTVYEKSLKWKQITLSLYFNFRKFIYPLEGPKDPLEWQEGVSGLPMDSQKAP